MIQELPSAEVLAARLKLLKGVELDDLAARSGVPSSTLWKIRNRVTPNPGIETVRKFYPLLPDTPVTEQPTQGVVNA